MKVWKFDWIEGEGRRNLNDELVDAASSFLNQFAIQSSVNNNGKRDGSHIWIIDFESGFSQDDE